MGGFWSHLAAFLMGVVALYLTLLALAARRQGDSVKAAVEAARGGDGGDAKEPMEESVVAVVGRPGGKLTISE